ncbi:ribonuclease H-like domain-containing protein [Novosphingobium flavum]|uniref:Ribonuclease H-like domain-containing protein n=1 Tax=Novosphingobium flavum TaxID=1778672 RepID=A0A7X1FP04_9SPHN|nr:ribonuclease H-like domain-containing protein [Novosphingobium flavum]MBC2664308.1 ribonuclease H-like domain-containing protein [Novosphingobium flavum]
MPRIQTARAIPKELRDKIAICHEHPQRVLFLDIETTGLSHFYDEITIVGWTIGGQSGTFIKGQDPSELIRAAQHSVAVVTFNGIRFDQRFLKQEFPHVCLPETHIDLMYLCRRVGLTGGQKAIEITLGLNFREDLEGVDGFAAVLLWHQYLRGDLTALKRLIAYNRADIAAMGGLMDHALDMLGYEPDLIGRAVKFVDWSNPKDRHRLPAGLKKPAPELTRAPTFRELFDGHRAETSRIVGIDLTGSEARPTGWCLLEGAKAKTETISSDDDLIERTMSASPDLVSIDSPLCLPFGRQTVFDDDPTRDEIGIMRFCERELKRRGVNVYPCLLPSMQKLTARGIRLAAIFRSHGLPVIESYPGAAQDVMRIPRKGAGEEWLKLGLKNFGIRGKYAASKVTHDELDAITSALVGTFHLAELSEELGTANEAPLIIPRLEVSRKPIVIGASGPIAAGKTTLAEILQNQGFAYTRFSLVIDDILKERNLPLDRHHRQLVGAEINRDGRQRELAERTISRVAGAAAIVVDGLRFPDDHAFLKEKFGFRFHHIHVSAPDEVRRARYAERLELPPLQAATAFDEANASEVERMVPTLRPLAEQTVFNVGTKDDMAALLLSLLAQWEEGN